MLLDPEGEARFLLRDFDARRPPGARALIARHLGPGVIEHLPRTLAPPGDHGFGADGRPKIALRGKLSPVLERWTLLHELAEHHLIRIGYRESDAELVAQAIAAALVMPAEGFRAAVRDHGHQLPKLARQFMATQTAAVLRIGEVEHRPVCVVAPTHIRTRAPVDEEFNWPPSSRLRELAKAKRLPPEVRRVALTDDRRRRALLVG